MTDTIALPEDVKAFTLLYNSANQRRPVFILKTRRLGFSLERTREKLRVDRHNDDKQGVRRVVAELGIFPPTAMFAQLHLKIQEELGSLTLFDDLLPTLSALINTGTPLAICSNLARTYSAVIDNLLPPQSI